MNVMYKRVGGAVSVYRRGVHTAVYDFSSPWGVSNRGGGDEVTADAEQGRRRAAAVRELERRAVACPGVKTQRN